MIAPPPEASGYDRMPAPLGSQYDSPQSPMDDPKNRRAGTSFRLGDFDLPFLKTPFLCRSWLWFCFVVNKRFWISQTGNNLFSLNKRKKKKKKQIQL